MRRYDNYQLLRPTGEWESLRVPRMFSAKDVQAHAPHSVVAMQVPAKHYVWMTTATGTTQVWGPGWAIWSNLTHSFVAIYADPTHAEEDVAAIA